MTVTVAVAVAEPAELVATSVYVVLTVGEYVCDPFNATELPLMVADVAFVVVQFNVTDPPLRIVVDAGVSDAVGIGVGGGAGAFTVTVVVSVTEPAELLATSV